MYFVHINAELIGGNMKIKELLEQVRDVELTEEQEKHIKEYLGFKESKKWRPTLGERYYYVDKFGDIDYCNFDDADLDVYRVDVNNCFKTEEDALFRLEQTKVYNELKNFADENNEDEIDWENGDQQKYSFYFSHNTNSLIIDDSYMLHEMGKIYFLSRELVTQAIEKVGEDRIKKYLFGVE